jgi:hypothetical protein
MRRKISSRISRLAPALLALGLILSPAAARAQNEPEGAAGASEKGRPLDGYLATLCLCGLALFIVGKTARR